MNTPARLPDGLPRRRFLDWVLGTWAAGVAASILYPIIRYLVPPEIPEAAGLSASAGSAATLAANSARIVAFGATPVIVVRTATGELRAFSATCTHLDCTVQYRADLGDIWCACHNGHYDLNGRNISGPPPQPLASFNVNLKEDEIMISRNA
jgi:cytochrome b6-f complex iron-sulfur subunit